MEQDENLGFSIAEHRKEPGKWYLRRNSRPYVSRDFKTTHLSKEAAEKVLETIIDRIKNHRPSFNRKHYYEQ